MRTNRPMLIILSFFVLTIHLTSCSENHKNQAVDPSCDPGYVIAIHGGAGTLSREHMDDKTEREYLDKLAEALEAGEKILSGGGSSLDAVQAAIIVMEDSPLFNAGKGAVFTNQKRVELDASVMDGKTLNAGATGGVIAVDRHGNVSMPFNTLGMYRGYIKSTGEKEIAIFSE